MPRRRRGSDLDWLRRRCPGGSTPACVWLLFPLRSPRICGSEVWLSSLPVVSLRHLSARAQYPYSSLIPPICHSVPRGPESSASCQGHQASSNCIACHCTHQRRLPCSLNGSGLLGVQWWNQRFLSMWLVVTNFMDSNPCNDK